MPQPENPHKDHRARLRARFLQSGLADFAAHNVLELLLFFPLPRRDTNPMAHALLTECGSVGGVLTADAATLCRVHGVGAGVVSFLRALQNVRELAFSEHHPACRLDGRDALASYFADRLAGEQEGVAIAYLDNAMSLIGERILPGISVHSAGFSVTDLLCDGLLCRAATVAVAHAHGDGLALPCREDLDTTIMMRDALDAGGLRLAEHFVISGNAYTTLLYRTSGRVARPAIREFPEDTEDDRSHTECEVLAELFHAAHLTASAAELIHTYGGLQRLLTASPARYLHAGLDEKTATLLALIGACDAYVAKERPIPGCRERQALGEYLCGYYRAAGEERVLLMLFDRRGRHIVTHTLGVGSVGEAGISLRRMAEGTLFAGAGMAVLAHNHPFGNAVPSNEDKQATAVVAAALGSLGVELVGHYIVAGSEFCVIK